MMAGWSSVSIEHARTHPKFCLKILESFELDVLNLFCSNAMSLDGSALASDVGVLCLSSDIGCNCFGH